MDSAYWRAASPRMAYAVVAAVKGDNPVHGPTWRWPAGAVLDQMVTMRVAALPASRSADDLLKIILSPVIAAPIATPPLTGGGLA